MIIWTVLYARIAGKHGVTADYVRMIHTGDKPAHSEKAKAIAEDIDKAVNAAEAFKEAVA